MPEITDHQSIFVSPDHNIDVWAHNVAQNLQEEIARRQSNEKSDGSPYGPACMPTERPGSGGPGTGDTGLNHPSFENSGGGAGESGNGRIITEGGGEPLFTHPGRTVTEGGAHGGGGDSGESKHGQFSESGSQVPDQRNQAYKIPHLEIGHFGHN